MAHLKTFKNYLIVAIFLYIFVMAGLAWFIGDSYILASIGILDGWH